METLTSELADDRLVISLDFGTTFSGVAYAFNIPGKKADVVSILDWPGKSVQLRPASVIILHGV